MSDDQQLKQRIDSQVKKIREAEKHQDTWLASTMFLGTLGIVFIIPVIAGAYLGNWLDTQLNEFSVSWTTSLVVVGVFVGGMNAYLLIRRGD